MKSFSLMVVVLLAIVAIVVVVAMLKAKKAAGGDASPWPFYAKKPLTQPEQILYFRLVSALPDHIVLAQVQLSRFLAVKKGEQFHAWNNRINRKSVDFLICAKDSTVVAAVELDDSTHARADRVKADATKNRAIMDAGVRIVRFNVKTMPDADAIRTALTPVPPAASVASIAAAPARTTAAPAPRARAR